MNKNPLLIRLYISPHNGCKQEQQQKPPSSDGFKSPVPKAREKWAAKKSGGQKRHKGHTLEPVEKSDHIKVHKVGQCAVCDLTLDLIEEYMEDQDTHKPDWYGQPGCQNIRKLPFLF